MFIQDIFVVLILLILLVTTCLWWLLHASLKGHFHLCNLTVLRKILLCQVEFQHVEQRIF